MRSFEHCDMQPKVAMERDVDIAASGSHTERIDPTDPGETVHWSAAPESADTIKRGGALTVVLTGQIRDGWHVYAFRQHPTGPIPLRVTLDRNEVASAEGSSAGSPPEKAHDVRFGVDVEFYTGVFAVRMPVRLSERLPAGSQQIPVSVRFQSCSAEVCLPPKTVHLVVPVEVPPEG